MYRRGSLALAKAESVLMEGSDSSTDWLSVFVGKGYLSTTNSNGKNKNDDNNNSNNKISNNNNNNSFSWNDDRVEDDTIADLDFSIIESSINRPDSLRPTKEGIKEKSTSGSSLKATNELLAGLSELKLDIDLSSLDYELAKEEDGPGTSTTHKNDKDHNNYKKSPSRLRHDGHHGHPGKSRRFIRRKSVY